jgi:hypothetical protein
MIDPLVLRNDTTVQVAARYQTRVITRFQLERDRLGAILPRSNCASENADGGERSRTLRHPAVRQTNVCRPRTRHGGDEGKAVRRTGARRLCCLSGDVDRPYVASTLVKPTLSCAVRLGWLRNRF